MVDEKKFLDQNGVEYLWSQLSLEDYPNNETLIAVLNAIDQTKADKNELFSGSWNDLTERPFGENEIILFEWNGNFSEITDIVYVNGKATYYRIGDTFLTSDEINLLMETHDLNVKFISDGYETEYDSVTFSPCNESIYGAGVEVAKFKTWTLGAGWGTIEVYNIPTDNFVFPSSGATFPKSGAWIQDTLAGRMGTILKCALTSLNTLDDKFLSENVAKIEDIPEVPVQSVNGMIGDVIINLDDYYNKTEVDAFHETLEDYVDNQVAALVNAAPETLDTLGELATAFEENKEVVEALDASITNKQDKISDTLILVDTVTGLQHKIQIQNGQLVSFPVE